MSLILIVDDEPQLLELLQAILTFEGHDVLKAKDGQEALSLMNDEVSLVITDLLMPDKEGLETITDLRRRGCKQPIIAITGGGSMGPHDYLAAATAIGADVVLAKPFSREEVLVPVRALLAEADAPNAAPKAVSDKPGQSEPSTISA